MSSQRLYKIVTASLSLKARLLRLWGFIFLLSYALLLILPINYQATLPFLDSSWGYALNYFVHSRYQFGPDLIFTYGPLGFLDNPQHVGHDIGVAVVVRLLFWILTGVQLVSLWRVGLEITATGFCLSLLLGHRLYFDYWDYSLLALTFVTVIKIYHSKPRAIDFFILTLVIGVTFLLKFTAFSVAFLMSACYVVHLLARPRRNIPVSSIVWLCVCLVSGPLFYFFYDRSPNHLAQYIEGSLNISSGFATAMATDPFPANITFAAILCALLVLNIILSLWQKRLYYTEAILIVLATWIVFRHGFVRGGYGDHSALFFGFSILIFTYFFAGWEEFFAQGSTFRISILLLPISFAAFTFISLSGFAERYPVLVYSNWLPTQNIDELIGLFRWHKTAHSLDHADDASFATLPAVPLLPEVEGKRAMVFPYSTPYVVIAHFEMFPIYALQAYSAYTSYLDQRGAQNMIRAQPPVDKVIMEWADIDGRNPMLDTPAMHMAFLARYQLQSHVEDALLLTRRPEILPLRLTIISHERFEPGEWVSIPARDQLVAMSIHLRQTFFGRLYTNFYCQKAVYIAIRMRSGASFQFRIPPDVLSTPGIINYIPRSLAEFEAFWGKEPLQDQVAQICLLGPGLSQITSEGYDFYQIDGAGIKFKSFSH